MHLNVGLQIAIKPTEDDDDEEEAGKRRRRP